MKEASWGLSPLSTWKTLFLQTNLKNRLEIWKNPGATTWQLESLKCVVHFHLSHCQKRKKTTTKKLQCVLPPHQHPHRNPQLLLSRSDGESSKTAPAWAPTLGPCWPLIWLPAWPITPPAKETYVVVEESAGSQLSASHFCTTQDVGRLTKHKKGDSYIKRYAIASWKMKEAGMKKTNREVDLRFFFLVMFIFGTFTFKIFVNVSLF